MVAFQGLANDQGSDHRDGRSRHLRGADRDRDGTFRCDSGGLVLQPFRDQARAHQRRATTPSSRNSPRSSRVRRTWTTRCDRVDFRTPPHARTRWRRLMQGLGDTQAPQAQSRDQRRTVHRRDARAADHLHGHRAAFQPRRRHPAAAVQRESRCRTTRSPLSSASTRTASSISRSAASAARTDRAGRAGGARLGVRARKPAVAVSHRRRPARGLRPRSTRRWSLLQQAGVAKVGLMSQPNPAQDGTLAPMESFNDKLRAFGKALAVHLLCIFAMVVGLWWTTESRPVSMPGPVIQVDLIGRNRRASISSQRRPPGRRRLNRRWPSPSRRNRSRRKPEPTQDRAAARRAPAD